jgi:hypothetical protein
MPGSNTHHGGFAFAFSGRNAFAFNAQNAFAFSASPPLDAYSFNGMPGNPMLAAGLANSRAAAVRARLPDPAEKWDAPDVGGIFDASRQPAFNAVPERCRLGVRPRSALAMLELLGGIDFVATPGTKVSLPGTLTLRARGEEGGMHELLALQCPDLKYFVAQLPKVDEQFTEREARAAEILTQVTPPISYFASVLNLQAGRHARTLELIDIALQFAYTVCMRFKQAFGAPRPSELSAAIQPMLEVPPHAAYPMGHANEAHVLAGLLFELALGPKGSPRAQEYLRRVAFRIGENRVVAGLHYPVDALAGRLLGDTLTSYLLAACGARPACLAGSRLYRSELAPAATDVYREDVAEFGDSTNPPVETLVAQPHPILGDLWQAAKAEW